ncbi:MAG TPA: M56 family metallopeptidase [Chitinophagaceae bacterium]|nr:M56 family metallopeptidase [Chitinophagaceae bacterium]
MPFLIQYLINFSVGIALTWLFYRLFLKALTFYNWNRWYLSLYSILVAGLSFIDISALLKAGGQNYTQLPGLWQIMQLPAGVAAPVARPGWTGWDYLILIILTGVLVMIVRLSFQVLSFYKMKRRASLLASDGVKIYQLDEAVLPFSFGNSIFISRQQHSEEEWKEIVRHEFIHVKQRHTLDIIWSEMICILQWYNPFAWLLRHAIRQNLEFIADRNLLNDGIDKKRYQYLLLKVVGVTGFSIAPQFNVVSLKTRIAMMNKMKSARIQLAKFLFVVPLAAIMLLAFRNGKQSNAAAAIAPGADGSRPANAGISLLQAVVMNEGDTGIYPKQQDCYNSKGYCISVASNDAESIVIVKDRQGNIVKAIDLAAWNRNKKELEAVYGSLPVPPPPPPVPPVPAGSLSRAAAPIPPAPPVAPIKNKEVRSVDVKGAKAVVILKGNKKETFDLSDPDQKREFESKYGPPPPPPPAPPVNGAGSEAPLPARPMEEASERVIVIDSKEPASAQQNPLIILDGNALPAGTRADRIDEKIKPDQIASIEVIKGDAAIKVYGKAGENGVINIQTRQAVNVQERAEKAVPAEEAADIIKEGPQPLYIIDGKEYDAEAFKALQTKPESIESIQVWKGAKALEKFGEKGRNGVVDVKLKKKE